MRFRRLTPAEITPYLAGTNTRRVRRALGVLEQAAVPDFSQQLELALLLPPLPSRPCRLC